MLCLLAPVVVSAVYKAKPEEVAMMNAKVTDLQTRSGHLSSFKALSLMRSEWPLGVTRDGVDGDKIGLYRIIGNPLPPRHDANQLHDNLRYLLTHEPPLKRATKIFVLNRLNASLEKGVRDMIEAHGHEIIALSFDVREYQPYQMEDTYGLSPQEWGDLILPKFNQLNANLYLMNNNGARNAALRHGIQRGWQWTMPFDGNCFFTTAQWDKVLDELDTSAPKGAKYAAIPMVRTTADEGKEEPEVLGPDGKPVPYDAPQGLLANAGPGEHQIAFHATTRIRFDPTVPYGHRPKVSLLWKLGIAGAWDSWNHDTVFRAEGPCYYLGAERKVKAPSVCERTLPAVDHKASDESIVTEAVVFRLPDQWPHHEKKVGGDEVAANPAGDDYDSRKNRRGLRDHGILLKISETEQHSPPSTHGADSFVKPVFFNLFSMEAMRRECLAHRAEAEIPMSRPLKGGPHRALPEKGRVDEHHCHQIDSLLALADHRLADPEPSVVDKLKHRRPRRRRTLAEHTDDGVIYEENHDERMHKMSDVGGPVNATARHFQNIGPYDWRLGELPEFVDLKRIQVMSHMRNSPVFQNKQDVNDLEFRKKHSSLFVRWEGHVRPDGRLWGPGSGSFDRTRAYEMMSNLTMFSLAHFYSGNVKYAEKAVKIARTWFLDPATAMAPTMAFAHYSRPAQTMFGVIQLKDLTFALDALALLERTHAWTESDSKAMSAWCRSYIGYLGTAHERSAKTNHGWWFLMQYVAVARCAGAAPADLRATMAERVKSLLDPAYHRVDGVMPHEMSRSRALHNHFFTAYALVLGWRALLNSGDVASAHDIAKALQSTTLLVDTAVTNVSAARMLMLDDQLILKNKPAQGLHMGSLAAEYAAPLCQWAYDYNMEYARDLQMCKRRATSVRQIFRHWDPVPASEVDDVNWPPALPTAPHTGVFPFMNLMW